MVFVEKTTRIDVHTWLLHTSNAQFFNVDTLCHTVCQFGEYL